MRGQLKSVVENVFSLGAHASQKRLSQLTPEFQLEKSRQRGKGEEIVFSFRVIVSIWQKGCTGLDSTGIHV